MMRTTLRTMALSIAAVAILAGCGTSSQELASPLSKVSFCRDNATLAKATASATTAAELVKALAAHQSTITHFGQVAPAVISTKAQVLVIAANAAIKSHDGHPLMTASFVSIRRSIDTYCGQKSP